MINKGLRNALDVIFKAYSNKEISEAIEVDITSVAKLRTGKMNMSEKNALKICEAFGYNLKCSFKVVKR